MKKIFITGATGLIGSHLAVEFLKENDVEIHCSYRSEASLEKLKAVCSYFKADYSQLKLHCVALEDSAAVEKLLQDFEIEEVHHTAAIVEIDGSCEQEMIRNNVALTSSICNALESLKFKGLDILLVHISSIAALGNKPYPELIDEETRIQKIDEISAYSQSKFLSENRVFRASEYGVRVIVVNPSVVMGVLGDGKTLVGMQQIYKVLAKGMPIYTKGVMGFVDVRDVARAMVVLAKNSDKAVSNRYLLNGENLDFKEFITLFSLAFGKSKPKIYAPKPLLRIGGGVAKFFSKIFGTKPLITPDTVAYMTDRSAYNGSKITAQFPEFQYTSIEQSAKMVADRIK